MFQAEDAIRIAHYCLVFTRVLFRSIPRVGRICVAAAWFGGIGRGGTMMTTGSGGGGGGGGGGLGAQAATLASRPTTMILRDKFIPVSPAAPACGVNPECARRRRPVAPGLR